MNDFYRIQVCTAAEAEELLLQLRDSYRTLNQCEQGALKSALSGETPASKEMEVLP